MAERMRCGFYVWESTLRGRVFENTSNDYCVYTVTGKKERDFPSRITVRSLLKVTPDSGREINVREAYPPHSSGQYLPQLVKQFSTFTKPTTSLSKTNPVHIHHTSNNHLYSIVIITMPWSVLRLWMEEGLKIWRVVSSTLTSSHGQPIRDGPPVWVLG